MKQNGWMARRKLARLRRAIRDARAGEKWDEIDQLAESGLSVDPTDTTLNFELGLACVARGFRDVAEFCFNVALESSPEREDIREILSAL